MKALAAILVLIAVSAAEADCLGALKPAAEIRVGTDSGALFTTKSAFRPDDKAAFDVPIGCLVDWDNGPRGDDVAGLVPSASATAPRQFYAALNFVGDDVTWGPAKELFILFWMPDGRYPETRLGRLSHELPCEAGRAAPAPDAFVVQASVSYPGATIAVHDRLKFLGGLEDRSDLDASEKPGPGGFQLFRYKKGGRIGRYISPSLRAMTFGTCLPELGRPAQWPCLLKVYDIDRDLLSIYVVSHKRISDWKAIHGRMLSLMADWRVPG